MKNLDQWILNKEKHLEKDFVFSDFISAMNFANKIAVEAEKLSHHPNLNISWGNCKVEIWTHDINGLSDRDFILASVIEKIYGK